MKLEIISFLSLTIKAFGGGSLAENEPKWLFLTMGSPNKFTKGDTFAETSDKFTFWVTFLEFMKQNYIGKMFDLGGNKFTF